MSKLEDLLQQFCPNGVKRVQIKSTFRRLKGTPITATKMKEIEDSNGEIRIFAGGKTIINAKEKDIPNANITRVPAVLVQSRGVIDVVYYDKPFTFKNEMWAYTADNVTAVKYLYYVLKNNVQTFRNAASGMGSLPQISLSVTEELYIPFPPLAVQQEIVRILDSFTELTAKLTAELTARRKQYEHYRDELLTFGDDVPVYKLSECTTKIASGNNKNKVERGEYPVYGSTGIISYTDRYQYNKECILVARVGANAGYVHIAHGKFDVSDNTLIIQPNSQVELKFLYYILQKMNLNTLAVGGGQPLITGGKLKELIIPVPAKKNQEHIVNLLDHFDTICNDLTSGLPAEIAARQKQYEYYRDKLLTFKELKT